MSNGQTVRREPGRPIGYNDTARMIGICGADFIMAQEYTPIRCRRHGLHLIRFVQNALTLEAGLDMRLSYISKKMGYKTKVCDFGYPAKGRNMRTCITFMSFASSQGRFRNCQTCLKTSAGRNSKSDSYVMEKARFFSRLF